MVYVAELRSTVEKNLERFLKSCIFYFLRNTKGEITGDCYYSKAVFSPLKELTKKI